MGFIIFCVVLWLIWFAVRVVPRLIGDSRAKSHRSEEIERLLHVLELDPSNSGSRAKLAGFLIEDGNLEAGIHEYRTAIGNSPQGPFTADWKRKLRDALQRQEMLARGEKPMEFNEWRVCPQCQRTVSVREKNCPRCQFVLDKSFVEWGRDPEVQREIMREAIPISMVLTVVCLIFTNLPMEWKGCLGAATLMVGGFLFLRSFNKDAGD